MNTPALKKTALASTVALLVLALLVLAPPGRDLLAELPWTLLVLACATLGLAPFGAPHIVEKLGMLRAGTLQKPIDWFDLAMHSTPWLLLVGKGIAQAA